MARAGPLHRRMPSMKSSHEITPSPRPVRKGDGDGPEQMGTGQLPDPIFLHVSSHKRKHKNRNHFLEWTQNNPCPTDRILYSTQPHSNTPLDSGAVLEQVEQGGALLHIDLQTLQVDLHPGIPHQLRPKRKTSQKANASGLLVGIPCKNIFSSTTGWTCGPSVSSSSDKTPSPLSSQAWKMPGPETRPGMCVCVWVCVCTCILSLFQVPCLA